MAINIYDLCTNPVTGESYKGVSLTPYAFTMQWNVKPGGYAAFEHIHLHQDEVFHVKKGELKVLIDGKEHIAGPGQKVVVTKGKRHIAFNNKDEEMETLIEYRPALDHEKFIQCFDGLVNDGYIDEKGAVSTPMMGYFLKKMKCKAMVRPTSISAATFKMALNLYYWIGGLKGWGKLYQKYTE